MSQRILKSFAAASLSLGLFVLAASPVLMAGTKDEEAKKYTEQLQKSKDPKVRTTAIEELGKLAQINKKLGEAAVPEIRKALKDKDVSVRKAASLAYGRCDPDESDSVAELVALLKSDKDAGVKTNAALGLQAMGEKAKTAVPALREAAKEAKAADQKKVERIYNDAAKSISGVKKKG